MRALRFVRGVMTTALAWAAGWAVAGTAMAVVMSLLGPGGVNAAASLASGAGVLAAFFGVIGAFTGTIFAIIFALGERRRSIAELSSTRMALWGALGGASYPLIGVVSNWLAGEPQMSDAVQAIVICGTLGAVSAWSMLRGARRAPSLEAQSPDIGPVST